MGAETEVTSQPTSDNGASSAITTEGSASSSSSSSTASSTGSTKEPKTQTVPTSVFKAIKVEHFDKGRKAGLAEANAKAQALGFKDYEDMAKTVEASRAKNGQSASNGGNGKSNGQSRQASNGSGNGSGGGNHQNRNRNNERPQPQAASRSSREQRIRDRQARRDQAERDAAAAKASEATSQAEQLKLQNEELQERLEAERAESNLRLLANRCGVQDVDYAITLLRRHCEKMSEADLAAFNDEEYFRTTLKKERPYLYEAQTVPATTGNGTATSGGEGTESGGAQKPATETVATKPVNGAGARAWALKNGKSVTKTAKELKRDEVLELTPNDYAVYMNSMGLTHPTMGMRTG